MAGNTFGEIFRVTTFGESHGAALGCVIDGCPSGLEVDRDFIQSALNRRRPGAWSQDGKLNSSVTARKEADEVEILSGVFEGKSTGTAIALLIRNTSQHSGDYSNIAASYRSGHADFTYDAKYGFRDYRGGGRSSGRETAARVAAGAVATLFTAKNGLMVTAYTIEAAGIKAEKRDLSQIEQNPLRAPDCAAAEKMNEAIEEIRKKGDSAGGIIECVVEGCPAGLGEPVFDKLDAELAKAILSVGAVKGIEFGDGFEAARATGSTNNDAMHAENGKPVFDTNHAGGILGGMSNGNKIVFRVAVKPVPSIFLPQNTVRKDGNTLVSSELQIHGRHDVCLCPRIVPVVEAMTQLVLADMLLRNRSSKADF